MSVDKHNYYTQEYTHVLIMIILVYKHMCMIISL